MNQSHTHYSILGLRLASSVKQIKIAFKKQIRKHHPDKNLSTQINFTETNQNLQNKKQISMKIIQAYQCLSDPQKKKQYDQQLKVQTLKSQLIESRHKDTISLSNKNILSTKNDVNTQLSRKNEDQLIQKLLSSLNQEPTQVQLQQVQSDDFTIFVCQQCFGQIEIANQQLDQLHKKQISINCQHCGLYMEVVQ